MVDKSCEYYRIYPIILLYLHQNQYSTNLEKLMFKKITKLMAFIAYGFLLTSCDPDVMLGIASGMLSGMSGTPSSYNGASPTYNYGGASSSYTTTPSKCTRCGGTGQCKTCGGAGQVYDWGPGSVTSKSKYMHKCGVCDGRKTCGVCDGRGYVNR